MSEVSNYPERVNLACDLIANGDQDARHYLRLVCYAARLMDDAVDGDHGPVDMHRLFHVLLVELPSSPFFERHRGAMFPIYSTTLQAWRDADVWLQAGGHKRQHALAFRDYLTELGLYVALLVGGFDHRQAISLKVRDLLFKPED